MDLLFPIPSRANIRASRKPFLDRANLLSERAYSKPPNVEFFDDADSENFVIHVAGLLTPLMNFRLLSTHPHGGEYLDATYLDLTSGVKIQVEWEFRATNFIAHGHDPLKCDMIFCWRDDLAPPERRTLLDQNPRLQVLDFDKVLHHYKFELGQG